MVVKWLINFKAVLALNGDLEQRCHFQAKLFCETTGEDNCSAKPAFARIFGQHFPNKSGSC